MPVARQKTLRDRVAFRGVGLHCGREIDLEILPAAANHGVVFVRVDAPGKPEIAASVDYLVDTTMATTLGVGTNGSALHVGTVEHLLAALAGLGIYNARVLLNGPEVPALDGSAGGFVERILASGIETLRAPQPRMVIRKSVEVELGGKRARLMPHTALQIRCTLDFNHPLIPRSPFVFDYSETAFCQQIAKARTFGFLAEVNALRTNGLALGGSLQNAIVIDDERILNPEGLRFADEFVRHKVLDALGDLSLCGMPIVGALDLHRSGHALNTALLQRVLEDRSSYEIVDGVAPVEIAGAMHTDSDSAVGYVPLLQRMLA